MMAQNHLVASANGEISPHSAPELRVFREDDLIEAYPLIGNEVMLGKDRGNDVIIEGDYVSRVHARIARQGARWVVEDVGSTNGTYVYEEAQLVYSSVIDSAPWLLSNRQEIRLGPHPGQVRLIFWDMLTTAKAPTISIDEKQRQVWVRGRLVQLPRAHYSVLLHLYREAPYPCSYDALCATIERDQAEREKRSSAQFSQADLASLHQLIHRLRSRIELDPKKPAMILQVSQFGYRLSRNS